MQFTGRVVLISAGIMFLGTCRSSATEPAMSVYVVDEFARVGPRDRPGAEHAAVLRAARNEYAPFQIVVRAGTGGLKRVNAPAKRCASREHHPLWVAGPPAKPVSSSTTRKALNANRAFRILMPFTFVPRALTIFPSETRFPAPAITSFN
jgi:hypothetical protein